jgi:hypothetical protein
MMTGTNLTAEKKIKNSLSWIPILIVTAYLAIKFLWKYLFISGRIGGVYWLFVFIDNETFSLLLAGLFTIISFVLFMVFLFKVLGHKGNYISLSQRSIVFFLCGLTLVFAVFFDFHYETIPVAELKTNGNIYYVAEYREQSIAFEYSLYQCDAYGFLCKRVNPRNLFYDTPDPKLIYNQTNHTISIVVYGKGVIYEYNLPYP